MFNIIFINIINIIIFIINKFEKKILLLLKKTIDLIWRVKLKIVVVLLSSSSSLLLFLLLLLWLLVLFLFLILLLFLLLLNLKKNIITFEEKP